MTTLAYTMDQFIEDLKALRQREQDVQRFLNGGHDLLARLVRQQDCVPAELRVPAAGRNHATYSLYRENPSGEGLSVTAVVWGPGDFAAPHDHHTWGLIGVVGNVMQETRYRRLDDRTRADMARIEQDRLAVLKPGEVSVLVPDADEIHRMDNTSDRPTIEIHVYGRDLLGLERCRFDPETGKISRFVTQKYDN